jgi:hypothetical protein
MDISSQTTANLLRLNTVSVEELNEICSYFLHALLTGISAMEVDERLGRPLCALSTFLLEACKARISGVKDLLIEQGVNDDFSVIIAEIYDKYHDQICAHMESTGISAPMIIGLGWRLDYSIRSNVVGCSNTPIFFVSLTVKDRGIQRNIDMIVSSEQLEDLSAKVKDAIKQTDRVIDSIKSTS